MQKKSAIGSTVYGQRVQKIASRARQPVEARDGEHVALVELRENAGELNAVGLRSACRLAKHLLGHRQGRGLSFS
jgi:hypothetical protein